MKLAHSFFILIILIGFGCIQPTIKQIDLSGDWQFAIDSLDIGQAERWFENNLSEKVVLPGSMTENGKGEIPTLKTKWTGTIYDSSFYFNPNYKKYREDGNIKFPFWLTPNTYYKGAAWYRKEVNIPENWNGQRITLHLERPHWQTSIWVNDKYVGYQNSLSTPHQFDLTNSLTTGKNFISVRVDNRIDSINVGPDSHSVTEHTQGNWNGIVGEMILETGSKIYIADLQLYPDIKNKKVKAVFDIKNLSEQTVNAEIQLQASFVSENDNEQLHIITDKIQVDRGQQSLEVDYPLGDDVKLWDEFEPNLYNMTATLTSDDNELDSKQEVFGMREIKVQDGKIIVNGKPVFLRGTLENNVFPLTGYPATDVASWEKIFITCKETGLNHVRFHSHCPPKAAFIAADKIGIYLQPEAASWPNHGTSLGNGRPIDRYILEETERIIKEYGNHPSFALWAYCNEPYGNYVPFLDASLIEWKAKDKRRIYTAASIARSWQVNPESEFIVRSESRGLPFRSQPNSMFNYTDKIAYELRPYVTHEMGQYCVYPDFTEIPKYTGVNKAKNFELFQEELNNNHMGDQAHDFFMASGKLQALCYKAEIEAEFRTPELDGIQLLGLTDFPGQGSAIIGLLNAFWEEKEYISKEEIKQFCNETVPLAEFSKFVYTNDETLDVSMLVSHFGASDLENVIPQVSIYTENGDTIFTENLEETTIATGQLSKLENVDFDLGNFTVATQCILEFTIADFKNNWEFWVFPSKLSPIADDEIYYTTKLDDKALLLLEKGGNVFLDASGSIENGKDVKAYFTPVFWNTSWFKMRPPHTLGILVQDEHPVFNEFPTSYHSNYQWWNIVNNQQVMQIDSFPEAFRPLVQPIDTWFLNRRLAQLFEARVGEGKLIVSSLNLESKNPASAQLRQSIVKYMNSEEFNPEHEVKAEVILELFEKKERQQVNMYTKGTPDELKPNYKKKK